MNTETDLVEISRKEVVEKARALTKEVAMFHPTAMQVRLLIEELAAAVSLLESREQIRDQLEAKNEG